ncbi:MAG: hypothetical protein WC661_11895 [Opitutaceae bacterium]|jgi:hypothetical protein
MITKPDHNLWAIALRAELVARLGEEDAKIVMQVTKHTVDALFKELPPVAALEVACLIGRIANEQVAKPDTAGKN